MEKCLGELNSMHHLLTVVEDSIRVVVKSFDVLLGKNEKKNCETSQNQPGTPPIRRPRRK